MPSSENSQSVNLRTNNMPTRKIIHTIKSIFKRLNLFLSMIRYGNTHNLDFAIEHYDFFEKILYKLDALGLDTKDLRTLEVGCGKAYWLTLLLHNHGMRVTGIDTEFTSSNNQISKYISILRDNGLERMLRTFVWDKFYAKPYYQKLASLSPTPLKFKNVDVRRMSITDADFPDNSFDLIVSHEVFEHIANIPETVETLNRILKPMVTHIYMYTILRVCREDTILRGNTPIVSLRTPFLLGTICVINNFQKYLLG